VNIFGWREIVNGIYDGVGRKARVPTSQHETALTIKSKDIYNKPLRNFLQFGKDHTIIGNASLNFPLCVIARQDLSIQRVGTRKEGRHKSNIVNLKTTRTSTR